MRAAWLALVLVACQGYQPEPYAEVRMRDEAFGEVDYDGQQFIVGARYVYKPQPVPQMPRERHLEPLPIEARTFDDELDAVGGWPWYAWFGLPFVLLAGAVLLWVWKRKVKANGK